VGNVSADVINQAFGKDWAFYQGDCVQVMPGIPDCSIDLIITSIPFSQLYIYSDSEADVGNAADKDEFFAHLAFVIRELLRITRPGRCCAVHVKDLPLFQNRDGVMGIDPFSDDTTAAFRREGWVLQSRVTVEKDPVIEMEKTNSHGLLYKNYRERAELLRVGLPDYVLIFQKPGDERDRRVLHDPNDTTYFGDNPPMPHEWLDLPTKGNGHNNYNLPVWQRYANPNWSDVVVPLVWTDINQTEVLNYLVAKGDRDERHICPLQLDLIGRLIHWKSNPGDVVFDPFGGIGSTPYQALKMGRKGVGVELKPEYWKLGCKYIRLAETQASQPTLWDLLKEHQAAQALVEA
jgi:DNA modification methylase